jgi:hypothetical protein
MSRITATCDAAHHLLGLLLKFSPCAPKPALRAARRARRESLSQEKLGGEFVPSLAGQMFRQILNGQTTVLRHGTGKD